MNAIETKDLTKRYKNKTAVSSLTLTVGEGELFALLGVNGAGKTTTIRMLSCLSKPAEGECYVCGHSCQSEPAAVKGVVGISPQDTAVAENLTVLENLRLMCGVYGYSPEKTASRIADMTELFKMSDVANSRAKTLSGGWKRKLSIAMALIAEPKVLFLDEPTLGLDVLARRELWSVVEELKSRITIVLTTHYMEEAEALSDRIGIMIDGSLAALGTLSELEAQSGESGLENVFVKIAEKHGKGA
ncbi:MAG: ABC transporter A subfamily ATP-binding protein [Lachnospiraceae bacterium]|nr:ABC transporter A subfamily ATP-binding protein [Ruminococcus sp.]MCM1274592.1 ABC transporter A subfamily ATP-binding protein [Lachnospiraceae bacterium]